jgi:hypothetical protein
LNGLCLYLNKYKNPTTRLSILDIAAGQKDVPTREYRHLGAIEVFFLESKLT